MNGGQRHLISILLMVALVALFTLGRADIHPVHRWNRAFADAAFVTLCLTLAIGPLARFVRVPGALLNLRRELGIWLAVAAGVHVAVYLVPALQGNLLGFFTEATHVGTQLRRDVFAAANWVGLIALVYLIVLAITSSDAAQRALGKGWKFLQQGSYTLFILAVIHAGLFLYIVINEGYGIFLPVFWTAALFAAGLQIGGYFRTIQSQRAAGRGTGL